MKLGDEDCKASDRDFVAAATFGLAGAFFPARAGFEDFFEAFFEAMILASRPPRLSERHGGGAKLDFDANTEIDR